MIIPLSFAYKTYPVDWPAEFLNIESHENEIPRGLSRRIGAWMASRDTLPVLRSQRSVSMLSPARLNNLLATENRLSRMSFIYCGV